MRLFKKKTKPKRSFGVIVYCPFCIEWWTYEFEVGEAISKLAECKSCGEVFEISLRDWLHRGINSRLFGADPLPKLTPPAQ